MALFIRKADSCPLFNYCIYCLTLYATFLGHQGSFQLKSYISISIQTHLTPLQNLHNNNKKFNKTSTPKGKNMLILKTWELKLDKSLPRPQLCPVLMGLISSRDISRKSLCILNELLNFTLHLYLIHYSQLLQQMVTEQV